MPADAPITDARTHKLIAPLSPIYVELHIHLDGAVRCSTLYELAQQRGIKLPDDVHSAHDLLKHVTCSPTCTSLVNFLETFHILYPVISGDAAVIERVAYEFVIDQYQSHIYYTEVRYSPQLLQGDKLSANDVIDAVNAGLQRGMKETGVIVYSILCCIRNVPKWSLPTIELANEYRDKGVVGVDIAADEMQPTEPHIAAFDRAHSVGLNITAHAGECNDPSRVTEAINVLHATRIGHGYACIDDAKVYELVKRTNTHMECCYTSSIHTGAAAHHMKTLTAAQQTDLGEAKQVQNKLDHAHHPVHNETVHWHAIQQLVHDDVNFSLNTDDPAISHINLLCEYSRCIDELGLTYQHILRCNLNAAKAAFCSAAEKHQLIKRILQHIVPTDLMAQLSSMS